MKARLKFRVKDVVNNKLVLVPCVAFKTKQFDKATGKQLTTKQLEKKKAHEIDIVRELTENKSFWNDAPSARLEIVADDPAKIKDVKVGDLYTVTLTKIK